MTVKTVSISATDFQAVADAAWKNVVDKIMGFLHSSIEEASECGFYNKSFSIRDLSRGECPLIFTPDNSSFISEEDEEMLWLMLFARLEGSGLRIRHSTDSLEGANAVNFFWGTAEQCGMSRKEFACLRVL